jgi:hypothetical protein
MGVCYYSYLRVVVDVEESDIIETVTETTTVCDHEHTSKFCPECGTPVSKRTQTETRKQFTAPFAHLAKHLDIEEYATDDDEGPDEDVYEEPDLHTIIHEWSGRVDLGAGLKLIHLTTDSEAAFAGHKPPLALVRDISRVGGCSDGVIGLAPDCITEAVEEVRKELARIGLQKEPRVVHMMYA